jgi:hypothetical protein
MPTKVNPSTLRLNYVNLIDQNQLNTFIPFTIEIDHIFLKTLNT